MGILLLLLFFELESIEEKSRNRWLCLPTDCSIVFICFVLSFFHIVMIRFKGEKLLECLAMKQVPLLRATWYIKIVGLSEMVSK